MIEQYFDSLVEIFDICMICRRGRADYHIVLVGVNVNVHFRCLLEKLDR